MPGGMLPDIGGAPPVVSRALSRDLRFALDEPQTLLRSRACTRRDQFAHRAGGPRQGQQKRLSGSCGGSIRCFARIVM